MSKWIFALLAVLVVTVSGCASSGGTSTAAAAVDDGGLPEIMPYDDEPIEMLPDMVAAEL
ncbi:MAG: hypothetical protein ACO1N8_07075 [Methylophilus sp.]